MSNSYHERLERLERAVLQLLEYAYVDALMGSEDAKAVALYATLRALDGDEKCARCGSLGTTVLCESVRMCADCEDAIREHYAPTPPPEPQPADFTDGPWSDPPEMPPPVTGGVTTEPSMITAKPAATSPTSPEMPPLPRWHREASTEELLKWQKDSVEAATAGLLAEIDDRVRLAKGLLAAKERAEARIAELERLLRRVLHVVKHDHRDPVGVIEGMLDDKLGEGE